jgi:uncharacterized membrane protein YgdD (TMEM256/DUF423 family)
MNDVLEETPMEPRIWLTLASLSGFIAVAAGAFGAHGARTPEAKALLETGGHYQLTHAVAVFACFVAWRLLQAPIAGVAAWLFLAGALIFSGSLYALALGAPRVMGAATPIGGLLLLAGWLVLAWSVFAGTRSGTF